MSEERSIADKYRLEAAEIRKAAEIVRDEGFRDQLLAIADEYEVLATVSRQSSRASALRWQLRRRSFIRGNHRADPPFER
jgi:hypothetical protein